MKAANKAVFLDRDGVLNASIDRGGVSSAPLTLADLQILDDVPAGLATLKAAGFQLIVVTNQPAVRRGRGRLEDIHAIHAHMRQVLPLDAIRVCFHDDDDRCQCRKPHPGMLIAEASDRRIDLSQSYLVGDRWRDIEAGKRAGCRTILIASRFPGDKDDTFVQPDHTADNLLLAADWILSQNGRTHEHR